MFNSACTYIYILVTLYYICVDENHVLHPFFGNRLYAGPVRLASIVHAFNYWIIVLQDGAKLALRIGGSRRAEMSVSGGCFYTVGSTSGGDVSDCECVGY